MKIKFLGAAMSVTGSCHLVTTDKYKILLDCGQFQGNKSLEALNGQDFGFAPDEIDFVILSHAHIDHSGRLPLLVKRGYKGKIYCTDATADLAEIMLKDSGYIHEKEAEWANKKAERAGRAFVEPLYTLEDAAAAAKYLEPVLYGQVLEINEDLRLRFNDAGHILGSAILELWIKEGGAETKLVFSGDIGVKDKPILRDPTTIETADYLIMETTYGDRVHETADMSLEKFFDIILKTIRRGGDVVIPSFAVGRTQELIYHLHMFYDRHEDLKAELNNLKVYIDSPLAVSATEIFRRNAQVFDDETREYILKGDNPLDFKNLVFTRSSEESRMLNSDPAPKIIISASGMCDAGRIKHHLKHHLWNPKCSVVFVGYQAEGTLGRSIVNGDKQVTIFGEKIQVNAEICNLEGFSGHADRDGLLEWLSGFKKPPGKVFLVHGEENSKIGFKNSVKLALGYDCTVVEDVSEYDLGADKLLSAEDTKGRIASKEQLDEMRRRLARVHEDVEAILYNADLAAHAYADEEKIQEINNLLLEIDKSSMRLGTVVAGNGDE